MRDVTSQPHGQPAPAQCVLAARRRASRRLRDGRRLHQKAAAAAAAVNRRPPHRQQREPPPLPGGTASCGEGGGGGGAHVVLDCAYRTTLAIETVWDQPSGKLFSAAAPCPFPPRGAAGGACSVTGGGPPPRPAAAGALRLPCWIPLVPPEILAEIFSHLDVRSLFSFSATCRYVYGTLHSTAQNWQRCDFAALAGLVDSKLEAFLALADAPWHVPNPLEERKEAAERPGDLGPGFDDAEERPEAAEEKDEGRFPAERCRARTNVWRPGGFRHFRIPSLPTPIPLRQPVFAAAIRSVIVDSTLVTHHILTLVLPRLPSLEHLSARRCPRIDIMRLAVAALVLVLDQEKWWLPRLGSTPEDCEREEAGADAAGCRRQTRTKFKQLKLRSLWIRGAGPAPGPAFAETQGDGDADLDESAAAAAAAAAAAEGVDQGDGVAYESSARRRLRGVAAHAGPARFGSRRGVGEAGAIPRPGEVSALRALTRALSALTSPERPVHVDLSVCSTCRDAVSVIGDGQLCVRCALPIVQRGFGGVCEQCCQVRRRCRACQRIVLCEGCSSAPQPFRQKSGAADDGGGDGDDRSPGGEEIPAVACCRGCQGNRPPGF